MIHPLKDYVLLQYHSNFGLHRSILPTRPWSTTGGTNGFGSYEDWIGGTRDVQDMIEELVDALAAHYPPSVTFDQWTVLVRDDPNETWNPVAANTLTAKVGTDTTSAWFEAVQAIFTFYDTAFNTGKLVCLDYNSRNNFARRSSATADADEQVVAGTMMLDTNAWSSRAQLQLHALRSISLGINDELKKQYPGI